MRIIDQSIEPTELNLIPKQTENRLGMRKVPFSNTNHSVTFILLNLEYKALTLALSMSNIAHQKKCALKANNGI